MSNTPMQKPSGTPDYSPAGDYIKKDWQRQDDNKRRWEDEQRKINQPPR